MKIINRNFTILFLCPFLKMSHPLHSEPGTPVHFIVVHRVLFASNDKVFFQNLKQASPFLISIHRSLIKELTYDLVKNILSLNL